MSNLSDAFDMTALRLQALKYAVQISPLIRDGPTIGPSRVSETPKVDIEPVINDPEVKEEIIYDCQWDVSQMQDNLDVSVECMVQSVTHSMFQGEMEKLRREMIRKETEARIKKKKSFDQDYRRVITEEAETIFHAKTIALQMAYEQRVANALRELDEENRRLAEEDAKRLEEIQKLKEARKDILKRQAEKSRMHQFLDQIQAHQKEIRRNLERYERTCGELTGDVKKTIKATFDEQFQLVMLSNPDMKSGQITEKEVNHWQEVRCNVEELMRKVEALIVVEKERISGEAQRASETAAATAQIKTTTPPAPVHPRSQENIIDADLSRFISAEAHVSYSDVDNFYMQFEEQLKPLLEDPNSKPFLQLAKFGIMSNLSKINSLTLSDLLNSIKSIFSGSPILINNKTRFNANEHPLGIAYCKRLAAEQFTIIECTGNWPSYAAAIVSLSHRFPDFAQLFRYFLYKSFPLLVPYFVPQFTDQPNEEYIPALVYKTDESLKNCVARLKTATQLFATILITTPRHGETNPFGIHIGWQWLVDSMNRDPVRRVSAMIISDFLVVAGDRMHKVYGKQFMKLFTVLQTAYLPKLERVDASDGVYLGSTLDKFVQTGKFV